MKNELKKGKDCIGQIVYDCSNNKGIITDFFVENGKNILQNPFRVFIMTL